jgi:hypothetical protein
MVTTKKRRELQLPNNNNNCTKKDHRILNWVSKLQKKTNITRVKAPGTTSPVEKRMKVKAVK